MKTFYVFNKTTRRAWYHNLAACGERCFGADVDGEYNPAHCGYISRKTAETAAQRLRPGQYPHEIVVFDREELFAHLDIRDWAYPHLKDAPSAAERRRVQKQARAEADRAAALARAEAERAQAQAERERMERVSLTASRAMALL